MTQRHLNPDDALHTALIQNRKGGGAVRLSCVALVMAVIACLGLDPLPAEAGDRPEVDIAVSDVFLNAIGYGNNYHHGWLLAAGASVTRIVGVVGEVGSSSDSSSGPVLNASFQNFMVGPRVAMHERRVIPFAQVLFGSVRAGNDLAGHVQNFSWQPGGGVDLGVTKNVFARIQGDYRLVPIGGDLIKQFRLAIGVVFRK